VLARVPPEAPPAWRRLDVVLAHHGLLAALWQRGDDPESVLIAHTAEDAVRTAAERGGVALLLRAPSPADVAAVARAGARMPRKSTLFVPKPRTGLVLRPLAD
jgi:acetaldehyde dehydrogenase (acetylating)